MADDKQPQPQAGPSLTRRNTTTSDTLTVPSTLGSIAPVLRIAEEIQHERPRVAFLCRFYAFVKAHRLDRNSSGRGVRRFITSILQRLERDNASSLASRVKESDARGIESYYWQYYENYIRALDKGDRADSWKTETEQREKRNLQYTRAQLGKVYETAGVLFEVLCVINWTEKVKEVAPEIIAAARDVQEKIEIYAPYNILPLDAAGPSRSIMQLDVVAEPGKNPRIVKVKAKKKSKVFSW